MIKDRGTRKRKDLSDEDEELVRRAMRHVKWVDGLPLRKTVREDAPFAVPRAKRKKRGDS
jgi:hypothetical protein